MLSSKDLMLLWSPCGKPVIICQGIIFQGTTDTEGARNIGNEQSYSTHDKKDSYKHNSLMCSWILVSVLCNF